MLAPFLNLSMLKACEGSSVKGGDIKILSFHAR